MIVNTCITLLFQCVNELIYVLLNLLLNLLLLYLLLKRQYKTQIISVEIMKITDERERCDTRYVVKR